MDIWRWVNELEAQLRKQGQGRLAQLVDRLPTEVCNDRHERVDALYPEALAMAQSIEHPWLEVFLRHWWLQSRILHRMDGTALGEAVSLVEFAHREATRDCPQSVCAVQDLASCYGFVDGPGFADERLEVSRETLARIDATWPCFTCISSEYAGALRSKGDVAGALAFIDRQIATLSEKGDKRAIYDLPRDRIECLLDLGRVEEALAFVADAEKNGRKDAHHRLSRRIDRARILVRLGRVEEAAKSLPDASEVMPTPLFYWYWVDAARELVKAKALQNDFVLGRIVQRMVERLDKQAVGRTTLELAQIQAELALERGAPHVARRALKAMERASSRLHRPLDALDRIAQVKRAIAAAPSVEDHPLPESAQALLDSLQREEHRDAERDLLALEAAAARWPADASIVLTLASCLSAMGLDDEAIAHLSAFHRASANDDVALRLGELLVAQRDFQRHREVAEDHRARAADAHSRSIADWMLARAAHARGDDRDAITHLEAVLAARPEAINTRLFWAECARRLGDHRTALARLDEVVERVEGKGSWDWDRMLSATVLGEWAKVRNSARRLGLDVAEGDQPIEERWELCKIRYEDEGPRRDEWAMRTGPVTARIVQIQRPQKPQHYGDVVVFDARPANEPPEAGREKQHVWVYPFVARLQEGGHRAFELDGVHPGEASVSAIEKALRALGCAFQVLSGDAYSVKLGTETFPGLFAVVALPSSVTPRMVSDRLREVTHGFAHPLAWTELAKEAGDEALAAEHASIEGRYGL